MDTSAAPSAPSSGTSIPNTSSGSSQLGQSSTGSSPSTPSGQSKTSQLGSSQSGRQTINEQAGIQSTKPTQTSATESPKTHEEEFFELKADKKTHKLTRQQMMDLASKGFVADSRFDEAAATKKKVEGILSRLKENPLEALSDPELGLSREQIRDHFESWYYDTEIAPQQLTPEQKEHRRLQAEIKQYKDREQASLKKSQEDQLTQESAQFKEHIVTEITEAFDKSGLPKTPYLIGRMAFYLQQNRQRGFDAPMDMIVRQVEKEEDNKMQHRIKSSTPEQLHKWMGEEAIKKVMRFHVEKMREARKQLTAPYGDSEPNPTPVQEEKTSYSDVNRRLNDMRRTGNY